MKDLRQEERQNQIKGGIWRPRIFHKFSDKLSCGASTKKFGIGFAEMGGKKLLKKWPEIMIKFCKIINPKINPNEVVLLNFAYKDKIARVNKKIIAGYRNRQKKLIGTDGVVSNLQGSTIMFLVADCVPTAIYDPVNNAMGIFHSSWHSAALNIVGKGIKQMEEEFGSKANGLVSAIGPAHSKNLEVKEDVLEFFQKNKQFSDREIKQIFIKVDDEHYHLDLFLSVKLQLLKSRILEKNMEISTLRTDMDNDLFPSYRLEGEKSDRLAFMMSLK